MESGPRPASPRPRWAAPWLRVVAAVVALGLLLYLFVPAALTYLAVGSRECLGPECAFAERVAVIFGVVSIVLALAGIVLLVVFAMRARVALLLPAVICIALQVPMVMSQAWATRTLSEGRAVSGEAMQVAFAVDEVTQDAVVRAVNLSVWDGAGIWGPDVFVEPCPESGSDFVAGTRLYFGPSSGVDAPAREAVIAAVLDSSLREIVVPPSVEISADWAPSGEDWILTVTSACLPLPTGE